MNGEAKRTRLDQRCAPIHEALENFRRMRVVPFDVPGHKRGRGNPELTAFLGQQCVGVDVNSMKPLDNLCHPVSVIREAEELAADEVARPGTSEHQLGLAADITDQYYEYKNESLENTELFKWMSAHCAEYGFIVRYPKDKEDVTGIMYEPWHFRYVGKEAAAYIMEHGLCLEEFVALYAE